MAAFGDLEAVLIGKVLAVGFQHLLVFLIPNVADALEEKDRQDVALPIGTVNRAAAQDVGGFPKMGFQGLQVRLL